MHIGIIDWMAHVPHSLQRVRTSHFRVLHRRNVVAANTAVVRVPYSLHRPWDCVRRSHAVWP